MRAAVVGHVEWVTFIRLAGWIGPGEILHSDSVWSEPAGGGGVAAAEMARLTGGCAFFTALGSDDPGGKAEELLRSLDVDPRVAWRDEPQRQATTLIGPGGDRAIIVHGKATEPFRSDPLPYAELAQCDAVYLCKGDASLVRAARKARVLVATARILPVLQEAGVQLDALVHSANDPSERYSPGDLDPAPLLVASTDGSRGGSFHTFDGRSGRWAPADLPGPAKDTYGAGDSFAAGLAVALAEGRGVDDALAFGAARGAAALCRDGAHGGVC